MTAVEGVAIHPSVIDGRTVQYADFLATWGRHCGAPQSVFQGHLNVLIAAELALAGQDLIGYIEEMATTNRRQWRALDRLLLDVAVCLEGHDGAPEAALAARARRARTVLGLETPP